MYGSIKKFKFPDNDKIPSYVKLVNEEIIQPMEREICVVYNLSSINDITEVIFKEVYLKFDERVTEDYEGDDNPFDKIVYNSIDKWFDDVEDKNPDWNRYPQSTDEPEPSEEVSEPKEDNPKGDPVKVFDWDKYYKYEDRYTEDILSDVENYVCRYYEVDTFKDLTQEMIDSVSWFFEKYGPSGVGLGFHLSEEVKVFVRKVNQYLHTKDEWDNDEDISDYDGDWNYRSREEYLPIE
jgi:hypothetical protein